MKWILLLACLVGCGWAMSAWGTAREHPNILFILVDDLGGSDLGCYGADLHETPNIDRLAGQGMKFTQAYAAAPVCSPTRASIMSGKAPARLHLTIWREGALSAPHLGRPIIEAKAVPDLPLEEVTVAEVLRDGGYETWHLGKWHLGDAEHYPETQGFQLNLGGSLWGAPATFFYPYSGKFGKSEEFRYVPGLALGKEGEYLTDRLTDEAIKLLKRGGGKPFFLNLWFHTVHTPIEGKKELVEHFRKKLKPGLNHQNAEYAAMVASLDENVGRLMATLEETGLARNTLVVLFSDNGGFVNNFEGAPVTNNSPFRSGKGSVYEGGIREPFIVRWPGVTRAGSVCETPVISSDFYPTLLEIAGLPGDARHNRQVDGISLVPLLRDSAAAFPSRVLCWHYPHYYPTTTPASAIRDGDWKLVHYYDGDRDELYNLAQDLSEAHDLAQGQRNKARELRGKLDDWLRSVDAQIPIVNPNPAKR